MLEDLPVCDDPLIVCHEPIADRRRGHDSRKKAGDQSGLPRSRRETCRRADVLRSVHSHSMVAGGLELTS